ncbi:hypothetical protein ONS95_005099 [Cadophora gregata]|uniref:uncharacterized protein n=1 Tax=Cadophora gregata TaxID=51156 RepID=UPI0026DA9419|nr:uncharacterized protein ONS95_005099 [Cadophora gregata]KAK0104832.1 hypothetical protein ONS95_005099 [Cadophora gregata]
MAALPTRIRQNIRDHFTSSTSPLVVKTTALTSTLGYPISIDPEWSMLWKTFQVHYSDSTTFVPNITTVILAWCDSFLQWLESESEENVDNLLELLQARSKVEIVLEVSPTSKRPSTTWQKRKCCFIIALPNAKLPQHHTAMAGFSTDFLNLLNESPLHQAASVPGNVPALPTDPDDWADLDLGSPESQIAPHAHIETRLAMTRAEMEDMMPETSTIPRPEDLARRPPYWLVVRQEGRMNVTIQGSHAPSLACLDEYLRRWCRGDTSRVNRPPAVEIKLQESAFGLGLLHDTLTLEAARGREVNAMLVLAFVENVLGYYPIPSSGSAGSVWEFKRTKGFK